MKFSAVIVTRGDVDLGPIVAPIVPLADELVIRRGVGGVWERWEAILAAKHEIVYTQDDDAIVDVGLLKAWPPDGQRIRCNMPADRRPEYQDGTALVGWGAFVPKALALAALISYRRLYDLDDLGRREADRIVTGLSPLELVDVPFSHAPWANGPGRMCSRAGDEAHGAARAAIRARIQTVRASVRSRAELGAKCATCGGSRTVGFDGPSLRVVCPECS
jgi:hypothetical protein